MAHVSSGFISFFWFWELYLDFRQDQLTVEVHIHCLVCFQHRPYSDAPQLFESGFAHGEHPLKKRV